MTKMCPHCGEEIERVIHLIPIGAGDFIEHSSNSILCAVIPFPTAFGLTELLERDNVVDVLRDGCDD